MTAVKSIESEGMCIATFYRKAENYEGKGGCI